MKHVIIHLENNTTRAYKDIPIRKYSTVLSMLDYIAQHRDDKLMYRHSCYHGSCGTCGMVINGKSSLACLTRVQDITETEIHLQSLTAFPRIAQLVPDTTRMFADFPAEVDYLRASETGGDSSHTKKGYTRLEDCIECGLCYNGCPVTQAFMGPAALAAHWTELEKHPEKRDALLSQVAQPRGVAACEKHFVCSRVCPSGVAPGKKITQLRTALKDS